MRPAGFTSHSQSTCRACCQADALVLRGACRSERSFGPGLRGWCNLLIPPNLFSVCSCPSCKLTLGVGPLFHAHPHHRKSSNTSVIYPAFTLFLKPSINERLDPTPARLDDVLTCNPCPYYDRSLVILVLPRCEETTLPCLSLTWPRRLTFARRTLDQSPLANLGIRDGTNPTTNATNASATSHFRVLTIAAAATAHQCIFALHTQSLDPRLHAKRTSSLRAHELPPCRHGLPSSAR